jgi:hypothetical protein
MELLTDMDRVRLVAALGRLVLTAREIDSEMLGLLLKLSGPETHVWVQIGPADYEPAPKKLTPDFAWAK